MEGGGRGARLFRILNSQTSDSNEQNASGPAESAFPPRTVGRGGRGMLILRTLDANAQLMVPPSLEELSTGLNRALPPQPRESSISSRMARLAMAVKEEDPVIHSTMLPERREVKPKPDVVHEVRGEPVYCRGVSGKVVKGTCNYIRLDVNPGMGVFEYEVRFEPRVDYLKYRRQILYQQEDKIGRAKTFDGVTLYLPHKLNDKETLYSKHPVDGNVVEVTIIFRRYGKMKDCIHLYNVLFKRIMSALEMTRIGRHYFLSQNLAPIPKYNLEVWPGYVTAIDEYEGGIQLCLDNSHRVLRTVTVHEMMHNMIKTNPENYKQMVINAVIGQTVLTRYNNRTYRIDDINWNASPSSSFSGHENKQITFMEYYRVQYGIKVKDPKQPMLVCRMKRLQGEQETEIEICLVPELSYLTGLTDQMRADHMLMKSVATYTRMDPDCRHRSLLKFVKNVNETPKAKALLSDWGLTLKGETVELDTRLLPEEPISTKNGVDQIRTPDFGNEITRKQMHYPIPIDKWYLLHTQRDSGVAKLFVDNILKVAPPMGIEVARPSIIALSNDRIDTYVNALRELGQAKLVVIIFPSSRDDRYSAVKKVACCDLGIPSQVINSRTLNRPERVRAIVQKIALQITCKLGGSLWTVKIPMSNAMICGIDIYHDPIKKGQSVGAFISSLNVPCTRWYCQTNFMDSGQELVNQFVVSMKNALRKYHQVNNCFPDRIFIYRDGIGDGQLRVCQELEVPQFKACFNRVSEGYNPKLTVFIVQKRINTRIFANFKSLQENSPHSREYSMDSRNTWVNPPPGTIVDSVVTRRNWADFFLVSQSVRQGTVTPTHYIILHDTSEMKVDNLQRLTYKLCFMYYNWPGGIRVPAPCQYAHKLAYLTGQHMRRPHHSELSEKLFFL